MIRSRWGYILLVTTSIIIAGCVRQAGQPFEPSAPDVNLASPIPAEDTPTPLVETEETVATEEMTAEAMSDSPPSPTSIPITVISPTETPLPILEVTNTPTSRPPTRAASATPLSSQAQSASDDDEVQPQTATAQALEALEENTGLLPSGPGGAVAIVTNTPVPTNTPLPGLITPTDLPSVQEENETLAENEQDPCTYIVQRGDNPFRIAVNNNVTLAELQAANPGLGGTNPIIQPGQAITIPNCDAQEVEEDVMAEASPEAAATGAPEGFEVYTVTAGDTLSGIAARNGVTIRAIIDANDIANPDSLSIGDELLIPIVLDN